jgi:hypothetical protein
VVVDRGTRSILREAITEEQKAQELEREGFLRNVAEELAKGWRTINTPMFVKTATHDLSSSGEYSASIEATNRITVEG